MEAVHYCISLSNIIKICTHAPARYQELDITLNFALVGFGFEALPRCCPFLKTLRLQEIPSLTGCFLPPLHHLTV